MLLREPSFEEPGRLVMVWERNTVHSRNRNVLGPHNYTRWRERANSFTGLAAFSAWQTLMDVRDPVAGHVDPIKALHVG